MKTYVLYHGNCPDGTGAALAAWLRFQEDAEYIPVNYGKPPPTMDLGSDVFILDFGYNRETLLKLKSEMHSLVDLDHHATAEKDLAGLDFCTFDMTKSGAVMTWEYFHGYAGRTPEFFLYLQDRDLWKFELPKSREVSMALRSYPMDFRQWSELSQIKVQGNVFELQDAAVDLLKKEGVACKRLTDQQVDNMAQHSRLAVFQLNGSPPILFFSNTKPHYEEGVHWAPCANATVFFSEVGERLLELNPEAQFAAYYLDREDGRRQWGLRSRPDFDCSVIAKAFGGGGHKCASGFIQRID